MAPPADAVARLECCASRSRTARARPATCSRCSTSRLAGDDGHGRAALLRLRDRRVAAGRAGRELARDRLGSERRLRLADARRLARWRPWRSTGCARSSVCPAGCAGAFVTGATMANFTSLAAARHAVLAGQDWDVEADGLFGAPPITVVIGEEAHPTLIKALGLVGFGRNRLVRVPVDEQGRMRAEALPPLSAATIVCAQAGNVNTGAFDPLAAIAERTRAAGAWLHVDGAFGLWAAAAARRAHLLEGVALADSWATDAHKWLNVPYDSGLAFVRDAGALRAAMAVTAEYLPAETGVRNPSDYTPELSRRARGVEVWAALRSLGRSGLDELIERNCRHAARFAEGLVGGRLRDAQRRRAQPGAGLLRRAGRDRARDRRRAGRRHLLVRRHGLAGTDGDAHQRVARGRRPTTTSSAAWRRSCASLRPEAGLRARPPRAGRAASLPGQADDLQAERQPVAVEPAGSDSAGQPSPLNGFVSAFMRVVLSGPSMRHGRARRRGAEQDVVAVGRAPRSAAAPPRARGARAGSRSPAAPRASSTSASVARVVAGRVGLRVVLEHERAGLRDEDRRHRAVVGLRPADVDLTRAHALARALEHRRHVVLERGREVAAQEGDAQPVEAAGEVGRRRGGDAPRTAAPPRRRCARSRRRCRSSARTACSRRAAPSRRSA